ncbi:MAG: 2-oxoacid:acceptor oxidoreductase family protein [Clostridiales Family XIII bacterium]|jgi:indolepyruvate ferredoxin oxidoreductase beta subunit|nr:2-oxoacid:acceptor oxidoreductase family protein [Clostridiales Family XIII bacterium]
MNSRNMHHESADNMKTTNILIAGVGGQGTVLAARLLGLAAMATGLDVRGSETIGMAQRGGSVVSHVRIGRDIASPLIEDGGADIVIAFEPGEAARVAPKLKAGGAMIVSDRAIMPAVPGDYGPAATLEWLRGSIGELHVISGSGVIESCGAKALNVALLGAAAALDRLPFGAKELENAIRERLPEKHIEANIAALAYGAAAVNAKK